MQTLLRITSTEIAHDHRLPNPKRSSSLILSLVVKSIAWTFLSQKRWESTSFASEPTCRDHDGPKHPSTTPNSSARDDQTILALQTRIIGNLIPSPHPLSNGTGTVSVSNLFKHRGRNLWIPSYQFPTHETLQGTDQSRGSDSRLHHYRNPTLQGRFTISWTQKDHSIRTPPKQHQFWCFQGHFHWAHSYSM